MKPDAGSKPQGFSIRSRFSSFGYAFSGLGLLLRAEYNAWIHLAATVIVIAVSFALGISVSDWRWIVLAIGLVWASEAFNTAIEGLCDIVSPDFDERIRVVKDVAAGSVLVLAIVAALIGVLTLGPYVLVMLAVRS